MQSERLYAIEPNRMKVLWERPITKASRLLGVDDNAVFLGGAELSALDLKTRKLFWATRVPERQHGRRASWCGRTACGN